MSVCAMRSQEWNANKIAFAIAQDGGSFRREFLYVFVCVARALARSVFPFTVISVFVPSTKLLTMTWGKY